MMLININPNASIDVRRIDNENNCIIVDDFLSDPHALVEFATANEADFELQDIGYPGVLYDVPQEMMADIDRFLRTKMSRQFSFFRGDVRIASYLSMVTLPPSELAPLQRLCHSDPRERPGRRNYAGLVYLFDNEHLGGTGFYRWNERELIERATAMEMEKPGSSLEFLEKHFPMYREQPRFMTGSNEVAELLLDVPARFNRFIFYSGDIPHSAHIPQPELLSTNFSVGRLTLNCFASVRPK
jgi:hypothetical protein